MLYFTVKWRNETENITIVEAVGLAICSLLNAVASAWDWARVADPRILANQHPKPCEGANSLKIGFSDHIASISLVSNKEKRKVHSPTYNLVC